MATMSTDENHGILAGNRTKVTWPHVLKIHAASGLQLHQHWWQWLLISLIIASVAAGSLSFLYSVCKKLLSFFRKKSEVSSDLVANVAFHLQKYAGSQSQLSLEKYKKPKPGSLGIYLGPFASPATDIHTKSWAKRDVIILDPFQENAVITVTSLSDNFLKPRQIVGRIDLAVLLKPPPATQYLEQYCISSVDQILSVILTRFKSLNGSGNGFTGVLLCEWDVFPVSVLLELCHIITTLDLNVYLEVSPPDFLSSSKVLASESITGLVVRNGLILPNGERRDCFDMEKFRPTVKAFVSQACLRDFTVLMWETLDDDVSPSSAVLKRTYKWCNFYSAVPWVGSRSALFDDSLDVVEVEPLSAFDWLKETKVVELHEMWRNKRILQLPNNKQSINYPLSLLLPSLEAAQTHSDCDHGSETCSSDLASPSELPDWFILKQEALGDPLCLSSSGKSYNGIGCFPLGVDVELDDFHEVVWSQRNLKKLELLDTVEPTSLHEYGSIFRQYVSEARSVDLTWKHDILELANALREANNDGSESIRVFLSLHTGFQRNSDRQFWAVYHVHATGVADLFISKNARDIISTLLHTFLSCRGFSRRQCFIAEFEFARWRGTLVAPHDISQRTSQDLSLLSPEECITLVQRMALAPEARQDNITRRITSAAMERLIELPSVSQLKVLNTASYLDGSISAENLIASQLRWHCHSKRPHPDLATAIALFREVEENLIETLKTRNRHNLNMITSSLDNLLRRSIVGATDDILALSIFCTMRKCAFEEVYIEVTDRNPLFNDQTDQSAAFAELFALGSRCESYFDVSPSRFGELLSKRYRDHYGQSHHQPPMKEETTLALSSAYAEAQIDVDPEYKEKEMPAYQRFTFLSVFAIPALIDILMLTTTGHGLYLSSSPDFMTQTEVHSATVALMLSLLLSGAIGTWITCGGTYYLASMAFSAMNYFVVTRLLGGFAFTLIVGLVGFIAFVCTSGSHAAIVFFFYLIALTTYLVLLAALANYQFIGTAFQSGRLIIILCIPVLFVSPLVTIFGTNKDVIVYLTVLWVFVTLLLVGTRYTGSRWATWHQKLTLMEDSELRDWYLDRVAPECRDELQEKTDPALLKLARQCLLRDVIQETRKPFWTKPTKDALVLRMARSYDSTEFLMDWYCRYSGVPKPMIFSSAWNVQTKVALESLQRSQLGIRFHNGFIHWRQAGDEIGCTILYFIIALLDKWISLMDGGSLTGLTSSDPTLRMPVGFGLAYYLVGAVLLDFNAHRLYEVASRSKEDVVPTDSDIHKAALVKSHNRKKVYWVTLAKYLLWHVWGLAGTTTLVWVFTSDETVTSTQIFLSYVLAYTGLLWYQYTKVFSGPHALKPMLIGVAIGLPLGFILHHEFPHFVYTDIIALGVATWTVAILSLWAGKIVGNPDNKPLSSIKGEFRAYSGYGPDQGWSQPELQSLHEKLTQLPQGERLVVDPKSEFGGQVNLILERCRYSDLPEMASRAFPEAQKLLELASKLFEEHTVTVKLVSVDHFTKYDKSMRAVSHVVKDKVQLFVGCETKYISRSYDPLPGFYQDVGELLIQAIAETFLGFTSRDAVLAQHLWMTDGVWGENTSAPSFLERQLRLNSKSGNTSIITSTLKRQLMKDLCLGFDCDLEWENLPEDIRQYLVNRCVGLPYTVTEEQKIFLKAKLHISKGLDFETYLARCDYAAFTAALSLSRANSWVNGDQSQKAHHLGDAKFAISVVDLLGSIAPPVKPSLYDKVVKYCGFLYHHAGMFSKFFAVAFAADPEYQREVNWTFSDNSKVIQRLSTAIFIGIWMWAKSFQRLFLPVFLLYRRPNVVALWKNIQGMEVSIKRKRITVRNLDGIYTGFIHPVDEETFKLLQYWGDHKTEPPNGNGLCSTNMYSYNMALLRRVELNADGSMSNDYVYEYRTADPTLPRRISKSDLLTSPITRKGIAGQNALQDVNYNPKGQIDSGSYLKDGNLIRFQYHYQKSSGVEGALLRAEFVLPHMSCTVSWCAPPRRRPEKLDNWIPHSQVTEATFVIGPDVWESKYFYDHKFHPTILTTLNGQRVETPPLILYDHLDVLKKPKHVSFLHDNPLFGFKSTRSYPITRWLGVHTRRYAVSTSQARSWLWKAWKEDPGFDGVIVRWLDERLLRRDPMLQPYWRKRDVGNLQAAEEFLDENRDAVIASVDLDSTISSWTPLAMKINDLYSFGQGGDACSRTRSNVTSQEEDDETALHVIAVDTGTWPNEGGGVSACRSDVINNLRTIKWHMVAEAANDFGIPKRQIERNVHSLKVIPLWGLDLMTPTHGLFANRLDSEVEHINTHATLQDIEQTFVPILAALISSARSLDFSVSDVKQVTRALINLNGYFNNMRHWSAVWRSDVVKNAWRRLWLSQIAANSRPSSEWLKAELPTLGQLDQGLELWSRYLFIFSIPIPDKMPAVFQASHHSVSASYGVVCKIKRGCTLQIWDHAISWRETNLYLSSALCALSPFTRNSLLGLMRMTSIVTLHHADTILPCADFFNPNWEVEIGTCQGKLQHRAIFKRKIDPVVNGITEMERFVPVKEIKTSTPTVTMLSHVWYAKDIKTALLAADIIINEWGFKDYRLDIYGALDKSPSYTTNCQEIIASKSLRHQVILQGEADPIHVLERTWVFLNSSISEGLPLALGEAALTGAPIVCTDVGASLRVLTDPDDQSCYSAVVAPNDARSMARAQIKLLALLEEWAPYADQGVGSDDATFPENPTAEDVARITQRMYDQTDARRRLGMKAREIVQKSFSGDRYLREHEQMLWVGKARKDMARHTSSRPTTLLPVPRAVHLTEITAAPVVEAPTLPGQDSLPSLAFGNSSVMPSSIRTSLVASSVGRVTMAEQEWVKRPQPVMVKVVNMGLRRESSTPISGMSADEIMV